MENNTQYIIGEVLIRKAHRGKFEEVIQLVEELEADVEYRNQYGCTVLHAAAASGQLEICQYLLRVPDVDPIAVDDAEQTALHYAAFYGHLEVVQLLVSCGHGLDKKDKFGRLAHNAAAINGHLDVVKYLLEECPHPININAIDDYGGTCLHWAASKGRKEVVQYLCISGIDNHVTSYDNRTAFQLAKEKHKQKVVQFLKMWTETSQSFLKAAKEGDNIELQRIINELDRAYPLRYLRDKNGCNALHCAASEGKLHSIMLLVENFDVITDLDKFGRNALHWACLGGHDECVEFLVKYGRNTSLIRSLTLTDKSPSRCAFEAGHHRLAHKLQAWEEGHDEIAHDDHKEDNMKVDGNQEQYTSGVTAAETSKRPISAVEEWLKQMNMDEYTESFQRDGFDTLRNVSTIDESDLVDMNVKKGHRRVFLSQIDDLKLQLAALDEQSRAQGNDIEPDCTISMLPPINRINQSL